jgi:hypothetical protein
MKNIQPYEIIFEKIGQYARGIVERQGENSLPTTSNYSNKCGIIFNYILSRQ